MPIGAVVVRDGELIAAAHNERELRQDPTAHAEILALREAARVLGSWRVLDATIYVTLEPCAMCAGAIVLARVARVVFGADDPKAGACGSVLDVLADTRLNHRPEVLAGLLRAGVRRAAALVLRRAPRLSVCAAASVAARGSTKITRPPCRGHGGVAERLNAAVLKSEPGTEPSAALVAYF